MRFILLPGHRFDTVGVPPLIQTLATLALYRGFAEGISQARSVRGYPEWFFTLGQGHVLGVPTQLWLWAAAIVVAYVVLSRTTFGRALYVIGNNETAARFSGVPVDRRVAMTGEITLRGKALPIGGLNEKAVAALRAGVRTILVPKQNAKDLAELPAVVRERLQIVTVDGMDEVLAQALRRRSRSRARTAPGTQTAHYTH